MTDPKNGQEPPETVSLRQWASLARENVTVEFIKRAFSAILETSPLLDSFSTWFSAGSAAAAALILANLSAIAQVLPHPSLKYSLYLLAVSILLGFAQKWTALQVSVFMTMHRRLEEMATPLFMEHEKEEEEIGEAAEVSGIAVETDLDVGRVRSELSLAFPWYLRAMVKRGLEHGIADRLSGHRVHVRYFCRQGVYAMLQVASLVALLILVAASVRAV